MKLIKVFIAIVLLNICVLAKGDSINVNFKDLDIKDLIKITSKIINKNILLTSPIKGKVDFISNTSVKKDEIINILIYVLQAKGFTIVENGDILRIVRINDTAKYNTPIINSTSKEYFQMVTKVFRVSYSNVDYVASKVRHLISKSAKLVTDKESNSIVITDFSSNIKTIQKVVNLITLGNAKVIEIVKLKNIDAKLASTNLKHVAKSIYNEKILKEKVSIIVNKNNNSITLVGKKQNVFFLKKQLLSNDSSGSLIKRVVEVISLKNVEAKNVIKIIDAIIGKKKYLDPNMKPLSSIDEESNSIILAGPLDEIEFIKELISKLDKDKLQVYVQARIIEVNESLVSEVGAKYGIAGGRGNSNGIFTFSSALNGGKALAFDTSSIGLTLPNISSGLALGASINLLKENYALDIVSEPSILCINNKECSIYVGETISIKTGSSTTDGGVTNDSFNREDIGLTLKVKPRISNDNKVTLSIETILEGVKQTVSASGNPDTSKKEVKTTAIVNNGESVIIGGLIENKMEETNTKVPLLGDLPLIGALFRNKSESNVQKNLVIVITPYIIPKSRDLSYVRNQLAQLKALESKYTKDMELRLLENKLKNDKNDKKRDKKLKKVKIALANQEVSQNKKKKISNTFMKERQEKINRLMGHD